MFEFHKQKSRKGTATIFNDKNEEVQKIKFQDFDYYEGIYWLYLKDNEAVIVSINRCFMIYIILDK